MQRCDVLIVGGGAAGLFCALRLADLGVSNYLLLERNDRVGKKLSATGNGQGNVSNIHMGPEHYFSQAEAPQLAKILRDFDEKCLAEYFASLGGILISDDVGRVYPASRQASSVTDLFRFALGGGDVFRLGEKVLSAERRQNGFVVRSEKEEYVARALVLACGGKASPHFGADGGGYALAKAFGHSVTPLAPAIVRLKTEPAAIRGLKGIRCDCNVVLVRPGKPGGKDSVFANTLTRGDVLFTENGVSGDAAFRLSSRVREGDELAINFLPGAGAEKIARLLAAKAERYPQMRAEDLLRGVVHSAVGRAALRRCNISPEERAEKIGAKLAQLAHSLTWYTLPVTGTDGFANAQVTRGGIPLSELNDCLMSRKTAGLFFAGEILDVDGECGGYNLQWAFSSAAAAAKGVAEWL